jgi:hypothetical protein
MLLSAFFHRFAIISFTIETRNTAATHPLPRLATPYDVMHAATIRSSVFYFM